MTYIFGNTTYGTLYKASYNAYEVRVGYELINQSQEDNASIVNAIMQCRTIDDTYQTWGYKQTSTLGNIKSNAKTFSVIEEDVWVTFATQTLTLQHNEDGTYDGTITGSFTTNVDFKWGLLSGSASVTPDIPDIPRYSRIEEITGEYLGEEVTITLSRELEMYKHTVEYSFEGSSFEVVGADVDLLCTFIPTLDLTSQIVDKTSGVLTVKVSTYLDGNKLGELTSTITLKVPDNVVPTISNVIHVPLSNTVPSEWNVFVKGNSQVKFDIDAEGVYGSTIKSYSIVGMNQSYIGTSNTFTSEILNLPGVFDYVITVTDTRDRQAMVLVTITVLDYSAPSISAIIKRCDENGKVNPSGSFLSILANFTFSSIADNNKISKLVSINGVIDTEFVSGVERIIDANLSPSENYTAIFSVADELGNCSSVSYLSRKDTRVLNITKEKDGIALNGFAERNKFKVNYKTDFMQDYACPLGQVLITTSPTPPNIGEWELIDKEFKPQTVTGEFTISKAQSCVVTASLSGHSIQLQINFKASGTIDDATVTIGTLNPASVGVTSFAQNLYPTGSSDGGGAVPSCYFSTSGLFQVLDGNAPGGTLASGQATYVIMTLVNDDFNKMIDSFCNKFYWKRVEDNGNESNVTVADDGYGNVTITGATVTDDGYGNLTIEGITFV